MGKSKNRDDRRGEHAMGQVGIRSYGQGRAGERLGQIGIAGLTGMLALTSGAVAAPLSLNSANQTDNGPGLITYEGGTIDAASSYAVDSSGDVLNNAGTLTNTGVVTNAGSLTNSATGAIVNNGSFTNFGIFTNAGSFINTGSFTNAGTLQIGTGGSAGTLTGNLNNSGSIDFDQTDASTYAGVISGAGTLAKHGAGTLTLTGTNTYTGATTLAAGTLNVDGSIASSVLTTVSAGTTLSGTGTVGNTIIASGGTLSPGNSIGTLNVAGDLEFSAGSRFAVEVNPLGSDSDLVTVSGTATLGGAVAHIGASGAYDLRTTYRILSAGALVGEFDGVTSNFAFLTPELLYDDAGGTVDLMLTRNGGRFAASALTGNQIATADGVESIGLAAGNSVYDAVAQLPNDADLVQASFDALSGEIHATAKTALINTSDVLRDGINERIRDAFDSVGASASPILAYGPDGPELAAPTTATLSAWGSAFGSWGHVDGDSNAAGLDTSSGGLLAGADALVGDWRLGLMAGYDQSGFDTAGRAVSGDSDNYTLGLYGGTQWGNLAFRSGLAYSWHDIETKRSVALLGETLSGKYGAGTLQGFGELGYRVDTAMASFEPFANLAQLRLDTDGFTETGGAAALASADETLDATFTTLGLRASSRFAMGPVLATVRGMVGWRRAFGNAPATTHAFAGSNPFTVAGAPIARDTALIEAGLDLDLSDASSLGLAYSGQIADGAQDHGISARIGVKF